MFVSQALLVTAQQQVIVFCVVCRWARSEGVVGKSYLPKSPLSALPATGILAGFGADFMSNHAFGRGTVAVPVFWIDTLVPQARFILQAVRVRNRTRVGKPDLSGEHTVESVLYLVRHRLYMFAKSMCMLFDRLPCSIRNVVALQLSHDSMCTSPLRQLNVDQHSIASVMNKLTWYCLLMTYHQAMCVKGSLLPFLAVAICGAA